MRFSRLVLVCATICVALAVARPAAAEEYAAREEAVTLVHQAIARVAEIGMDKAQPEFMDRAGKFVIRDLYLVIIDKAGIRVVHGQNPKLVGKTYYDAIDMNGKAYGKDVQNIAEGAGKGWISFAFKDPITGKVLPKENYVVRSGDYTYLAGVYIR
jgi:cytochrome c